MYLYYEILGILRSKNNTIFEVYACLSSGPSVNSWSGETEENSIQQPEGVWLRPEQRRSDIQTVAHCIMATWKQMFWKDLNSTFHIPVNLGDRKKRLFCICFITVSTQDYFEKIKKCNRKLYVMCFYIFRMIIWNNILCSNLYNNGRINKM